MYNSKDEIILSSGLEKSDHYIFMLLSDLSKKLTFY